MAEDAIKENIELTDEIDGSDEAETQVYELGFHIAPSVDENNVAVEADAVKFLIKSKGGTFIAEEFPKEISLAYTITKRIEGKKQRFDTAYFGWIKFEMKTDNILAIKEEMDINKNILRYLIIKTVKESTLIPKTIVFAKDDSSRKSKPKSAGITKKMDEAVKKKPTFVSEEYEEDLDKTIEKLIVE